MSSNKKIKPVCSILKSIKIISPEDITFFGIRWLMRDRIESFFVRCYECERIQCQHFRGFNLAIKQEPSLTDLKYIIDNYLPILSKKFSVWRGLNLGRDVSLNDVYVSHMLYNNATKSSEKVLLKDDELLNSVLSDLKSNKKSLIYGYAGSGKTTLLRRWTLNISISAINNIEKYLKNNECLSPKSNEFKGMINPIPIYLSMGEIGQICGAKSSWNASIPELAAKQYSNSEEQSKLLIKSLTAFMNSGKSIILLDAADEVPKEAQPQIRKWLEKVKVSLECPVILTSRPHCEYILELSNFEVFDIEEFDASQIKEFINKWFSKSPNPATIDLENLINKLDRSKMLSEMAKNPLFLTMMCIDFEVHGKIMSRSPGELFYQFVCILLMDWDRERGVKRKNAREIPTSINIELDILGYIASKFNEQIDIPVHDLINYIQSLDVIKNISIDANDIIKDIESTSGILIHASPGFYRFCHSLFRDFFHAFNIVGRVKNGEIDWGDWQKDHYWDFEFQNINAFFVELKEMEEVVNVI